MPAHDERIHKPVSCLCGHNAAKHTVAGFDGACITCRCRALREPDRTCPPRHVPVAITAGEAQLVASGWVEGVVAEIGGTG